MRRASLILALPLFAIAQDRGVKLFNQNCAVGYCHGSGGSANRAPRLAGRNFERGYLQKAVEAGLPNTAMPGFKGRLSDGDISAIVGYVVSLSGGAATGSTPAATTASTKPLAALPADARKGKDLFFDAVRGTRCSTCHAVEGMGTGVGPNLAAAPPRNAGVIQNAKAAGVQNAVLRDGDRFPALVVEKKGDWVKVFDLTVTPPVLRTVAAPEITLSPGNWSHANAIAGYQPGELESIAAYLRWLAGR